MTRLLPLRSMQGHYESKNCKSRIICLYLGVTPIFALFILCKGIVTTIGDRVNRGDCMREITKEKITLCLLIGLFVFAISNPLMTTEVPQEGTLDC